MGVFPPGFQKAREAQVSLVADRHRDMTAFGRGYDAAPGRVVHRRGIDAGAEAHHQHRGIGHRRRGHDGAQILGRDMAERLTLGLQVVQDGDLGGPGRAGQLRMVDDPSEVGHLGHAMPHRASGGDTGRLDRGDARFTEIAAQDRFQTVKFGVGEFGHSVRADLGAIGKGDAGVGAADIGEDGSHGVTLLRGAGRGGCARWGRPSGGGLKPGWKLQRVTLRQPGRGRWTGQGSTRLPAGGVAARRRAAR